MNVLDLQYWIDKCPISVEIVRLWEYNIPLGYYESYNSRIKIHSWGSNAQKIAELFHEQTHAEHDLKGCRCIEIGKNGNYHLAEYHAV